VRSHLPPHRDERDGFRRPSPPAPRAVVVARDPDIRDDWARALEAAGMLVTRCVGPTVSCVIMRDGSRCPLLDEAGLALYHEVELSSGFEDRLRAVGTRAMVVATRDRHRLDRDHEPAMSHVIASPST
jgi:hypothetical protein